MDTYLTSERVIHRVLERQAAKYGNRSFLFFKEKEFSYEQINLVASQVAYGLQKLGIGKGDKVAIMLPNCPEFLFLWFGLSKLAAIEVPINTAHKSDILQYMLDQSDSCMLIMDNQYLERIEQILPKIPKIKTIIVFDTLGKGIPDIDRQVVNWTQMIINDGSYQSCEVQWSDPFVILYTSGTTGVSKGCMMPQNYGLHLGELAIEAAEYNERDCLYTILPLFHGNAQLLSLMPALMSGARLVLAERFSASSFWEDIKRYRCTAVNYIGGILPILFKADPKPDEANNPLRIMLGGGAPMDIFEAIEERFGVRLIEVYGSTEIGVPLMNLPQQRKLRTCGNTRPDYVVKVVDDNGLEVGPNTPGEVLIRPLKPYSVFLEYYKMPEKTLEACRDLWFHTGDYLYYDEDGFFSFVDRKKDAIRRRGENISSYEVEKVINSHPAVMESAALGIKCDMGEDEVMVCLELKPGQKLSPEDLLTYCEEHMAYFMIPRYVRFMGPLPKTPTERIKKDQLRDQGVTDDTWDREREGFKLKR